MNSVKKGRRGTNMLIKFTSLLNLKRVRLDREPIKKSLVKRSALYRSALSLLPWILERRKRWKQRSILISRNVKMGTQYEAAL